jgi:glucose-fructose oxidoreductase
LQQGLALSPADNGNTLSLEVQQDRRELVPGDSSIQFARQVDYLADAIRDGTLINTPGEMGLRDLRLIEAIYASTATGRTVMLNPGGTMAERVSAYM